jgi:uncharacterized protein (TIRG00374 family)
LNKLLRRLIVAMLLGVVIYGAIVHYRGAPTIARQLSGFAWWTFGAACALAFSNYVLRFLKWEYYLARLEIRGIPKGESFLTFLSGFVLTVTPGKVGEVFKSLILFQLRGVPIARTAPIVVAERVTDLIGIIVLIAAGSVSFHGGLVWASIGMAAVLSLLVFVASPALSEGILRLLPRLPGMLGRIFAPVTPKLLEALTQLRILTTPRLLVLPTLLSICAWALEGIALWVIVRGFGEHARISPTTFSYATATLAGALVPVPGGLGVTDKLIEELLMRLGGVPPAMATAAMLLTRLATLWFAVAVGFCALAILRARNPALSANPEPAVARAGHARPAVGEKTP